MSAMVMSLAGGSLYSEGPCVQSWPPDVTSGGPCTVRSHAWRLGGAGWYLYIEVPGLGWGEVLGLSRSLYNEVQCIICNGHMGTWMDMNIDINGNIMSQCLLGHWRLNRPGDLLLNHMKRSFELIYCHSVAVQSVCTISVKIQNVFHENTKHYETLAGLRVSIDSTTSGKKMWCCMW